MGGAMKPKRVLLVCSEKADEVIKCLRRANCVVTKVKDGETAIDYAKHKTIDAFVLVSTGNSMGRSETALNLRDMRPSSEIVFVARAADKPTEGEVVAKAISNTYVLTLRELGEHFARSAA
jgi:DNA-binding response OmpR family regulator